MVAQFMLRLTVLAVLVSMGSALAGGKGRMDHPSAHRKEQGGLAPERQRQPIIHPSLKKERERERGDASSRKTDDKARVQVLKDRKKAEKRRPQTHVPPGKLHKGKKATPPGWNRGRKVGWQGGRVPPGHQRK